MSGWVVVLTGQGMSPLRAEIFGGWHAWVIHNATAFAARPICGEG
jgi:hypothetical protein